MLGLWMEDDGERDYLHTRISGIVQYVSPCYWLTSLSSGFITV